jgi:dipeptidyl aminopeptidase/acylaminoacyl peptidase
LNYPIYPDLMRRYRLSPDGLYLAWVSWNHPDMPWDGTELWLARLDIEGLPVEPMLIAGGRDEAILQPKWPPDGRLYFISDRSGWWNLYRRTDSRVERVVERDAELGDPPWIFGHSSYVFQSANRIIFAYKHKGFSSLASVDTTTGRLEEIETPYTEISFVCADAGRVVFLGSSPTEFPSIVELRLATGELRVLRCASDIKLDQGYLSIPKSIEFPTEQNLTAYGFLVAPQLTVVSNERG